MTDDGSSGGPPEVGIQLALQFTHYKETVKKVELVCHRWRTLSRENAVWETYCDLDSAKSNQYLQQRNAHRRNRGEEEEEWLDEKHEVLATQLMRRERSGRTYREIFAVSRKAYSEYVDHLCCGPDQSNQHMNGSSRTLRQRNVDDFVRIVGPSLEKLREVFSDWDNEKESLRSDMETTKSSLLKYAQQNDPLRCPYPSSMEKDDFLQRAGEYILIASTKVPEALNQNMFVQSSPLATCLGSVGELVGAIEKRLGDKIQLSKWFGCVSNSKRKKARRSNLADLDWPLSPVDVLSLLVRLFWVTNEDIQLECIDSMDHGLDDDQRELAESLFYDKSAKDWWVGLGSLRSVLLVIYRNAAAGVSSMLEVPSGCDLDDIPSEIIRFFVQQHRFFRFQLKKMIWNDLRPEWTDALHETYQDKQCHLKSSISIEFSCLASADKQQERVAQELLGIFLEVPGDGYFSQMHPLTATYCDELPERMTSALDRWNYLANSLKSNDEVLWGDNTFAETEMIIQQFCSDSNIHRRYWTKDWTRIDNYVATDEFCAQLMVKRFLYQQLSSPTKIPHDFHDLSKRVEGLIKSLKGKANSHGVIIWESVLSDEAFLVSARPVLEDMRIYSQYIHTREQRWCHYCLI